MDQDNIEIFKKSFRGYNVDEVDEFIDGMKKDISSLKSELSSLYGKLSAANDRIEKYRRTEEVSGDIIKEAKVKADGIVNDAKGRAARVIIRTSRQCNRIVADMVSQVEEQKNIYETAKKEVVKFRRDLFNLYADHVKRINAYSEAAGVFDTDALSQSELDSFIKLLGSDEIPDVGDGFGATDVSSQIEAEVNKIKKEAEISAEEIFDRKNAPVFEESAAEEVPTEEEPEAETEEELTTEEPEAEIEEELPDEEPEAEVEEELPDEEPEDGALYGEEDAEEDIGEFKIDAEDIKNEVNEDILALDPEIMSEEKAEAAPIPDLVIDEEDADEFGEEGPMGNVVNEFDGPVSVNNVFGSLSSYDNVDFEAVYGERDYEEEKKPEPTPEEILERRRRAEDDSNEFYSEDDVEFDPFVAPEEPTAEVSIPKQADVAPSAKKRWKLKRSMTITDEFKAVSPDEDD